MTKTTVRHLVAFINGESCHVLKYHQGHLSCDCPGYRFHGRKCKHLEIFRAVSSDDQAKMFSISKNALVIRSGYINETKVIEKEKIVSMFPEYFKTEVAPCSTSEQA